MDPRQRNTHPTNGKQDMKTGIVQKDSDWPEIKEDKLETVYRGY
jgi:hypothetical protein